MIKSMAYMAAVAAAMAGTCVSGNLRAQQPDSEGWVQLFNGKDLAGWKANEHPEQWKVEDGAIVAHGARSHLFYEGTDPAHPPEFKNFHFKAELMTLPNSNSGIFFHVQYQDSGWPSTGIEVQVNNTHKDPVKTGSLYIIDKNFVPPAKDNEWFTEEIIVQGKHVITKVNGQLVRDYTEPAEPDLKKPHLDKGTFALQAHDPGSTVRYRKVEVKPLP